MYIYCIINSVASYMFRPFIVAISGGGGCSLKDIVHRTLRFDVVARIIATYIYEK